MTTAEIQEIKVLVLRELPAVLAQDTEFALVLEGMLSERFPRRDEFARLLEEMKVKSTADHDDIDDLADKVELVRHLHPGNTVEGILVMLGAERDHRDLCAQKGLKLIP